MKFNLNTITTKIAVKRPEIQLALGIAGVIFSGVLACRATLKVKDVVEDTQGQIKTVKQLADDERVPGYDENKRNKDVAILYGLLVLQFVKLYGPALLVGGISIASIINSNSLLKKRNAALISAYSALDKAYKNYRKRVIDKYGEEAEEDIYYDRQTTTVVIEKDDGTTETREVTTVNPEYSPYAKCFDELNPNWDKDASYNMMFLKAEEDHANNLLIANGFVFLNDIYKRLGFPVTKAGQFVGWIYDPNNPDSGDNYIDFGIMNKGYSNRLFINGHEPAIFLDFNVDGPIVDKI